MDARMAARTRYVWIGASVALYASFAASLPRVRARRASGGWACWSSQPFLPQNYLLQSTLPRMAQIVC